MINFAFFRWGLSTAYLSALVSTILFFARTTPATAQEYQFTPQCDLCHTMPPLDSAYRNISSGGFRGNHATHNPPSVAPASACEKCHADSASFTTGHRNGFINMTTNLNSSPHPSRATYNKARFFNQTSNPVMLTCSNVNCHFETTTPLWGSAPYSVEEDCSGCHSSPGQSSSHIKHDTYFPLSANGCTKCHPDYKTSLKFSHATSAGHAGRGTSVTLEEGSYSGTGLNYLPSQSGARVFGNCSDNYCHSRGTKSVAPLTAPTQAATWGGTLGCAGCHEATPATGNHYAHVGTSNAVPVPCYKCHAATVTSGMTISSTANHVNRLVNISFNSVTTAILGKYSSRLTPMQKDPGSGYGSCENVYCHSTGQGAGGTWPPAYSTPKWGDAATGACGTCHDHGYHSGPVVISSGSHGRHVAYGFGAGANVCVICHYGAGVANPGCTQCHFANGKLTTLHVNRMTDVSFVTKYGGTYSGTSEPGDGYGTCSNVYCHSNGTSVATGSVPANTSPAWGSGTMACSGCHGNPPAYANGTPKTNSHGKHAAFACNKCHFNTTSDGTSITSTANHVNKAYNVNAGSGASFSYVFNASGGTCSSISCHFNGSAQWGTTIACGSCHPATGETMTSGSHTAHLVDARGPIVDCDSCHGSGASTGQHTGHANGVTDFSDGNTLASTSACNICHSPGGTYDGVSNANYGAKSNWTQRIYSSNVIRAGKEKWCASCHDESPAVFANISAPNVVGNESGAYTYGTGWGYYKTGHGLPASEKYPASGGITAGAAVECSSCHDSTTAHLDGVRRTFDDGESLTLDPSYYRQGYRLRLVDAGQGTGASGREPLLVPAPVTTANSANNHRLCVNCHAAGPFVDSGDMNTNLVTDGINRHEYHLRSIGTGRRVSSDWDNTAACSSDWNQCNSRMTCTSCHNIHGSTKLAMVNDGKLVAREPGLNYWYYTTDLVNFVSPPDTDPTPATLPLTASAGTVWSAGSSSNLCSHCHGNTWLATESRTPFQNVAVAPNCSWAGTAGYVSDGVDPDTAGGGSSFTFRVKFADGNNDAPSVYQVWIDKNDNGTYEADEKFDMAALDGGDLNYFDGKLYTYTTQIYKQGDNTLNYRFYFRDAASDATGAPASDHQVTVVNSLPNFSWTGETNYATDGVDPNTGGNGSTFTFRVKYTDLDNEAPDTDGVRVLINGTYYTLDAEVGGSYGTGKIYSKGIALSTAGDLNYLFVAKDPAGVSATGEPATDHVVTVLVSSNNPPLLEWTSADCLTEGVRPRTGAKDAEFEFRVKYRDLDNECPTSIQVTVNGTPYDLTSNDGASCQTGRIYYGTTAIASPGDLNYSFSASDGADAATGTPVSNHVVSVIDTAYKLRPTGGSGWYSDLATAYNETPASGTLLVYPNADFTAATYTGGLSNINKTNRTLQSVCGAAFTIISGGNAVITLQGNDGAVIDGFGITGGTTYGIYSNGDSLTLKNSKVYSSPTGVHLNNGCNPVSIQNTEINGNTSYGVNSPSTLNLVSITGSNIHNNSGSSGAGISLNGGAGSHTITGTSFTANSASTNGGAIYCTACTVSIDDSSFRSNTAGAGGAIYLLNASTATITDTFIQGNSVTGSGGGISIANAAATANLTNVVLTGNKASSNGGAIFLQGAINALFSTVSGNYAGNLGGGVYNNTTAASTAKNSIMYNNDAANGVNNKQIYSVSGKEQYLTAYYTLINQAAGGAGSFSYTDGGNNDTSGNPDFMTPIANPSADTPTTAGDFRIQSGSPAINAASATWTADHDIFGDSRPLDGGYDMGADEAN